MNVDAVLQNGIYLDTVDSTNEEAKRLIDSGKIKNTTFIVASCQTRGKGTHGRNWVSPKGKGIYLSVVHIVSDNEPVDITLFTKSAGVASVEGLKEVCNIDVRLKPINDLYAQNKKLGGILVETRLRETKLVALVTGVGINTDKAVRNISDSNICPISIEELNSKNFSKKDLTETLVAKIMHWHNLVFKSKCDDVIEVWERNKLAMLE